MAASPLGTYPCHGTLRAKGHDRGKEHDPLASTRAGFLGSAEEKNRSSASLSLALPRDQPPGESEVVPGPGSGVGIMGQCMALMVSLPPWQHTEALLYGFQSIAETIDVNYSDVVPGLIGLIPRISISNVQLADTVMFTIGKALVHTQGGEGEPL